MMSVLYLTNLLSWIYIVLAHSVIYLDYESAYLYLHSLMLQRSKKYQFYSLQLDHAGA
jgi:hypothetical protein